MTDDEILDRIIAREGRRYTDRPSDKGGPTKFGITLDVLREWRHGAFPATAKELQALTEAEARQIYRHLFLALFADVKEAETKELLFDCAVHHGRGRSVRWLQEALDVDADGILGPVTRAALAGADLVGLYRRVLRRRLDFLGDVVSSDFRKRCGLIDARIAGSPVEHDVRTILAGCQAANCAGWISRAASFVV